jgi:dihydroneopterin aldolase
MKNLKLTVENDQSNLTDNIRDLFAYKHALHRKETWFADGKTNQVEQMKKEEIFEQMKTRVQFKAFSVYPKKLLSKSNDALFGGMRPEPLSHRDMME